MKKIVWLFLFVAILSSCTMPQNDAPEVPQEVSVTALREIIENPAAFDGKKVLLSGTVAGICVTARCHFVFQDSGEAVTIHPKGFDLLNLRRGQPVRVYAEINALGERVVVSALGLEID